MAVSVPLGRPQDLAPPLETGQSETIAMHQTLFRQQIWVQTTIKKLKNLHPKEGVARILYVSNNQASAYAAQ